MATSPGGGRSTVPSGNGVIGAEKRRQAEAIPACSPPGQGSGEEAQVLHREVLQVGEDRIDVAFMHSQPAGEGGAVLFARRGGNHLAALEAVHAVQAEVR